MKRVIKFVGTVVSVTAFVFMISSCSSSDQKGCTSSQDCAVDNQICDPIEHVCKPKEECSPDCSGKCAGADNGCEGTCSSSDCAHNCCGTACCTESQTCDDQGQCCTPKCEGKCCGDDGCGGECPDKCSDGSWCIESVCQCSCAQYTGADTECTCDDNTCANPTVPCPQGECTAYRCKRDFTLEDNKGFCTFPCSGESPEADAECSGAFQNGCCMDISGKKTDFVCVTSAYCGPIERNYLETCDSVWNKCKKDQNLKCVPVDEKNAYCLYQCTPPDGPCADDGTCSEAGICMPPGNHQEGELCKLPIDNCAKGLDCVMFPDKKNGFCATSCNCVDQSGCTEGKSTCVKFTGEQIEKCWCIYLCPNQKASTDCPNNGDGWHCEDLGTPQQPAWACIPD